MSENKKADATIDGGLNFSTLLAVLFIGLKLGHVIDWSWWWVLAPLWIWLVVIAVLLLLIGIGHTVRD